MKLNLQKEWLGQHLTRPKTSRASLTAWTSQEPKDLTKSSLTLSKYPHHAAGKTPCSPSIFETGCTSPCPQPEETHFPARPQSYSNKPITSSHRYPTFLAQPNLPPVAFAGSLCSPGQAPRGPAWCSLSFTLGLWVYVTNKLLSVSAV